MSGVSITYQIQGEGRVQSLFRQLGMLMTDTTSVMRAIGTGLVENTHTRFERAVDPDGTPWVALNPLYASGKKGPGILRESAMRGGLMGSITMRAAPASVEVGTNKIYAAVHQFGATIEPKNSDRLYFRMGGERIAAESVTIPARPYLGIGREDELTIMEALEDALDRAVGLAR